MRLRANIRRATGNTRHLIAGGEADDIAKHIAWVEISPEGGAFLLLYCNAAGECLADTWHASLAEAKQQARFEFEIEDGDWQPASG